MSRTSALVACLLVLLAVPGLTFVARSEPLTNADFHAAWSREDQPVASGAVSRTWLWGPEPFTPELTEPYASSPGGQRTVQYFDKARMEINDPVAERGRWYVTTGLLASELMTGAMQTGDGLFEQRGPALIPVAGDADDESGPTYASFDRVRRARPFNTGTTLVATIDRNGDVGHEQHFALYNVLAETHVPETGHTVASVFWDYLNATGSVVEDGEASSGRLFESWMYASGLPVTEAYWASVKVNGRQQDVLIQVFERRVLTYTPANDPAWRVELGNVDLHYYWWRYERDQEMPAATGEVLWAPDLTRIPGRVTGDGWTMDADPGQHSLTIAFDERAGAGASRLVSRSWYQPTSMPDDAYRVSVNVQVSGPVDAGIGFNLTHADGAPASMLYFGVSADGIRYATLETFDGTAFRHLLRPAGGLSAWNGAPGSWNQLAVTVTQGRAWLEVNAVVVGEIELPGSGQPAGVALAAGQPAASSAPAQATFWLLTIESAGEQILPQ